MITVDFSRELRKQGQFVHTTAENLTVGIDDYGSQWTTIFNIGTLREKFKVKKEN